MNYNELSENLLIVKPEHKRSIKGSINLRNLMYHDLNEKVKALDFDKLSEEDYVLIDKWKAVSSLTVTLKSFIPDSFINRISSKQSEVRSVYKKLCIDDDVPYMTRKNWEELRKIVEVKAKESNEIIEELCNDWEEVKTQFVDKLQKILPDFSREELTTIALNSIPTVDIFRNSYKKTFRFSVSNITNDTTFIDIETNEEIDNKKHFSNEIEEIIKNRMLDVYLSMDNLLYAIQHNAKLPLEEKTDLRPKRRIGRLVNSLSRVGDFFTSKEITETETSLKMLQAETNNVILFEEAEKLGLKAYEYLMKKKYIDKLPDNSVYFSLDKINEIRFSL